MSIPPITGIESYTTPDGRLTLVGQQLMQEIVKSAEATAAFVDDVQTGWAAPTGTASRATFDPATASTVDIGQRLKALIDDLTAHGLIGE